MTVARAGAFCVPMGHKSRSQAILPTLHNSAGRHIAGGGACVIERRPAHQREPISQPA